MHEEAWALQTQPNSRAALPTSVVDAVQGIVASSAGNRSYDKVPERKVTDVRGAAVVAHHASLRLSVRVLLEVLMQGWPTKPSRVVPTDTRAVGVKDKDEERYEQQE
jgi:hypothetical protein